MTVFQTALFMGPDERVSVVTAFVIACVPMQRDGGLCGPHFYESQLFSARLILSGIPANGEREKEAGRLFRGET